MELATLVWPLIYISEFSVVVLSLSAILTSVQSLLCDPNPASPANAEASRLYDENRWEYNRRVRDIVEQSWVDER